MTLYKIVTQLNSDSSYSEITAESIVQSFASYVRTIRSLDAPSTAACLDHKTASPRWNARACASLKTRLRCYICHAGGHFTGESFHNTGIAWHDVRMHDPGRAK